MKIAPVAVRAIVVSLILAATQGACGGGSPTTPPTTTTSTTSTTTSTTSTTTTSTTSTTTTSTTSTTTTTTTSTLPRVGYAAVHQIWSGRGCTGCHTGSQNRLNLSGGATATCAIVTSGQDVAGGQYLNEPTCTAGGSSIVSVPATGMRPNGQAHPGGTDTCFGSGGTCRTEILAWCSQGANCTN